MGLLHLIDRGFFRTPYGAVKTGTEVTLRACICPEQGEDGLTGIRKNTSVFLRLRYLFRNVEEISVLCTYSVSGELPEKGSCEDSIFYEPGDALTQPGFRTYTFILDAEKLARPGTYFYAFSVNGTLSPEYQLTVFEPRDRMPEWFTDSVIYQIFPDRFCKGAGAVTVKPDSFMYASEQDSPMYIRNADNEVIRWEFFGGNLFGIAEKLDYIRSLGAKTVYLNPIFESVSNHRYDTADYEHVDGLLGGDEAFEQLAENMKAGGMRLILDGVFSHTGAISRYFDADGRYSAEAESEADKGALQSDGSKYRSWYKFTEDGEYDCWWHVKDLPCVKELEPSYLNYTVTGEDSIIRRWTRAGAAGWRLDVADELPDEYIEALRRAAKEEKPDAVIIGEVWEDATDKVSYGEHREYFTRPELDSHTNYVFRDTLLDYFGGTIDGLKAARAFAGAANNYPPDNYRALVNMTGSHDVPRLFTCLLDITRNDAGLALGLLKSYTLIQFTLPGVPLIYYGDEICMEGGKDPGNRGFFKWDRVESQKNGTCADKNIVDWLRKLGEIRKEMLKKHFENPEFIDPARLGDVNLLVFTRKTSEKMMILAIDRFGRGTEYLNSRLITIAEFKKLEYNVIAQAESYGFLAETADIRT